MVRFFYGQLFFLRLTVNPIETLLVQDANSPSPVLNAVYSIDWAQQMAGLSKISDHPLAVLMVSASQRVLGPEGQRLKKIR